MNTKINKYLLLIMALFCAISCFSLFSPIQVEAEEAQTYTLNFYDSDRTTILYTIENFEYGDYIIVKDIPFTIPDGYTHFTGWYNEEYDYTLKSNSQDSNGSWYYYTAYYGFLYFAPSNASVLNFYPTFSNLVEIKFYPYSTGYTIRNAYLLEPGTEYNYSNLVGSVSFGYEFVGWKIEGTSDSELLEPIGIATSNVSYRAVFKKKTITITFYDDDKVTILESLKVLYNEYFSLSSVVPTKNYATFSHWETSSGSQYTTPFAPGSDLNLYAVYDYIEYEIKLYSITLNYRNIEELNSNLTTEDIYFTSIYVKYGEILHDIDYPLPTYDDIYPVLNSSNFHYGSLTPGMIFDGWYEYDPTSPYSFPYDEYPHHKPITSDLSLYACFTTEERTLNYYNSDGTVLLGSFSSAISTCYHYPLHIPDGLVLDIPDGYSFIGWSDSPNDNSYLLQDMNYDEYGNIYYPYDKHYVPVNSDNLYAIFEVEKYKVVIVCEQFNYKSTKLIEHGANLSSISPTFTGYTFSHFEDYFGNIVTEVTSDIQLFAFYDINQYNVFLRIYENYEYVVFQTLEFDYNSLIYFEDLPQPTKEGYSFSYWNYSGYMFEPGETLTMPAKDLYLTAEFSLNKYLIDFYYLEEHYLYELEYNSSLNDIVFDYGFSARNARYVVDSTGNTYDFFSYRIPARDEIIYCILSYEIEITFWDNSKVLEDENPISHNYYTYEINSKDYDSSAYNVYLLNFDLQKFRDNCVSKGWNLDSEFYINFVKYPTNYFRCNSGLTPTIEVLYYNSDETFGNIPYDFYIDFQYLVTYQTHNLDGTIYSEESSLITFNTLCPFDIFIDMPNDRFFLKWNIYNKNNEVVGNSQVTCYVNSPLTCRALFYDEDSYSSDDYYEMLKVDDYFGFSDDSNSWLVSAFMVIPKLIWNFLLLLVFKVPVVSDVVNLLTGGLLRMVMISFGYLFEFVNLAYIGSIAISFLILHILVKFIGGDS